MALKKEAPLVDYITVRLKCEEEEVAAAGHSSNSRHPPLQSTTPRVKLEGVNMRPVDRGRLPDRTPESRAGWAELDGAWRQEYLVAESQARGQPICMVCGSVLTIPGPKAAREHILQHHAHSLGFSAEEKRNILEAWSEGVALPEGESPPCPPGEPSGDEEPAEIEVLIDSEEQPVSRRRGQPRARPAPRSGECPA
uniref:SPIN-DOC-like zinc-finger domain-containing protein n=1 Tax=Sphenodon punctatus TaxID=8508 RepID=A0A8D0GLR6_SPHPU